MDSLHDLGLAMPPGIRSGALRLLRRRSCFPTLRPHRRAGYAGQPVVPVRIARRGACLGAMCLIRATVAGIRSGDWIARAARSSASFAICTLIPKPSQYCRFWPYNLKLAVDLGIVRRCHYFRDRAHCKYLGLSCLPVVQSQIGSRRHAQRPRMIRRRAAAADIAIKLGN